MKRIVLPLLLLLLGACEHQAVAPATAMTDKADPAKLRTVLAAQPAQVRARYAARNPAKTLAFFGITPGSTVVEALPSGGWYSKILIDYLGPDGQLIGVDYAQDMWPKFGFFSDEFIAAKETWTTDWLKLAQEWRSERSAPISAAVFGRVPTAMHNSADAVLFIRALHNLNRFESDGGYLTMALKDAYNMLKPGGVLGIVQHEAPAERSDEFALGDKGYLKKAHVIESVRNAGFEYVGSRKFNANPKDQPGEKDIVWRLPPTLINSGEDAQLRAQMEAIGESNRMTLKFRKPYSR